MRLKVLLPEKILVDETTGKITAEAQNGFFTLLPRHIDFVAALVPGLLSFDNGAGETVFLAVDEGVLIKRGAEVLVSTRRAVRGERLGELRKIVEEEFRKLDDREKSARSAMAKIEAGFVRRFLEVQGHG
ncbi:MAG: F0F1 ATP synthase subunit epsilon [Desulfatiglandales bacterium]